MYLSGLKQVQQYILTDVSCLDHTHVIATVADAAHTLFRVLANQASNVSFLGWRATASNDSR